MLGIDVTEIASCLPAKLDFILKNKEQLDVVVGFINGSDVFTILPMDIRS